ncbi:substrate-binding periplasmic protein [Litoribrevibacter albus]|uniref:Solute-binding protein family 3/N-terminal domain-containing protein n=1 Tax=Litoribrevibacter albus TaxID=1473156 RepID=A0AA37S9L0_9GAMM|nr:transporter substrate-binding domain-containing protein [Litoribrevibacter albus]GLQ30770.1 hypothetical protein GCM10007876_12490 [Litoribrevibacter albus]
MLRALIAFLLSFYAAFLHSEEVTINIVGAEFPPYYTKHSDNHGIIGEVIQKSLENTDFKPRFKIKPFARALIEAKSGKADIIAGLYKTTEREQFFHYTDAIINAKIVLYTLTSNPIKTHNLNDLISKRIGMIRHSSTHEDLSNNLNITEVNSYQQGLDMLLREHLDFMVGNELVIQHLLNGSRYSNQAQNIKYIPPEISQENTFIATSRNSLYEAKLFKQLNQGIEALKQSGKLQKIIQNNLKNLSTSKNQP